MHDLTTNLQMCSSDASEKINCLEQRLEKLEAIINTSLHSTQLAIQTISAHIGLPNVAQTIAIPDTTSPSSREDEDRLGHDSHENISHAYHVGPNLISKAILTDQQCRKLYDLYVPNVTLELMTKGVKVET